MLFIAQETRPYEKDLNYIWTCHRSVDSTPSISSVGTSSGSGCFGGTGAGRLAANTRSFVFQSDTIGAGKTIIITLFATKGFRNAETSKTCRVVASPPQYAVR